MRQVRDMDKDKTIRLVSDNTKQPSRDLTAKQIRFLEHIVYAGDSIIDAYINSGYGKNSKRDTMYANASRLFNNSKVLAKYDSMIQAKGQAELDADTQTKRYVEKNLRDIIDNSKNDSSRVSALKSLGETIGMFQKVVINEDKNLSAQELENQLEQKLLSLFKK